MPLWDRLTSYPGSVLGTFFDVYEDGRMDILLLHQKPDHPSEYVMAAVKDTQEYDAMFLKVWLLPYYDAMVIFSEFKLLVIGFSLQFVSLMLLWEYTKRS